MVRLRDRGKVRFIGISELSEGDGTHEVRSWLVENDLFNRSRLTTVAVCSAAVGGGRSGHPNCSSATAMPLSPTTAYSR